MRFSRIRFVEQTEQKFRRFESVLKKTRRERLKSAQYLRLRKRRTLFLKKLTYILLQISKKLKGDPLEEKKIFKKVSQCRKTERGALWGFSTSILSRNMKKIEEKIFYFREKSHSAEKNERGGPFGIFQHPFCRKTSKKCRTLWGKKFRKKCLAVSKKIERGALWSRRVWYVTRENRKNLFGSVR